MRKTLRDPLSNLLKESIGLQCKGPYRSCIGNKSNLMKHDYEDDAFQQCVAVCIDLWSNCTYCCWIKALNVIVSIICALLYHTSLKSKLLHSLTHRIACPVCQRVQKICWLVSYLLWQMTKAKESRATLACLYRTSGQVLHVTTYICWL